MPVFNTAMTLKLQTTTDADLEEVSFDEGAEVELVETWDNFYLIKDDEGNLYNVPRANLDL